MANPPLADQNQRIADAFREMGPRIARFVRRRVGPDDAEDILQDVFSDLLEARLRRSTSLAHGSIASRAIASSIGPESTVPSNFPNP